MKPLALAACLLAGGLLLTACGGNSDSAGDTPTATASDDGSSKATRSGR